MPLFFILSGLCVNIEKYNSLKSFIIRKINILLVPYIFFSVISIVTFSYVLNEQSITLLSVIKSILRPIVYGWGRNPLWFIPILFLVELFYFLYKKYNNFRYLILVCLLALLIFDFSNEWILYSLNKLPWYLFFYFVSAHYKNHLLKFFNKFTLKRKSIYLLITAFIHFIIIKYFYERQLDFINDAGNSLFYFSKLICSVLGSLLIILSSILLSKLPVFIKNIFLWIGKNTLIIMSIHIPIKYLLLNYGNDFVQQTYVWFSLEWIICIISIFVLNQFVPFFTGKKEIIKL
jgi:fucose 4-O-acetylase-like acetyltransferase